MDRPDPTSPTCSRAASFPDDDHFHDECGVFGVYNHPDASALTALGLHALQHRGQEAAGIVTFNGGTFHSHRAFGSVGDNFNSEAVINRLDGDVAIGHVRYSTSGGTAMRNIQPLFADLVFGGFAIAHNGNLTNARTRRHELVESGCIFQSTSDTETILHMIATSDYRKVLDRLIDALKRIQGAYSLVALTRNKLLGVRDPYGVRPLVIGRIGDAYVLASETCALDIIGATYERDVEPGEIVVISREGIQSLKPFSPRPPRFCIFEYIYFARPDSVIEGRNVYAVRKRIGQELARESHVDADMVVPVPDSGVPAAIGYAEASGVPFDLGIIRSHYMGRTFIQPHDTIRHLGVKLKHNANRAWIKGKRLVLVDDSIVRGTTSVKIVEMMRAAGAAEVHMRISSPPTTHPCFYGIDTPHQDQLMAHRMTVEEMAKHIGVDSLAFISHDGMYRAVGEESRNAECPQYCDACFTGAYPISLVDQEGNPGPAQLTLLSEA
ncbi:MAG: amidophosphoribosyltransferase [Alphaproteobacteria bacterium]|nr:amidophosphoribosyltransferase [Alphaproteobacteria bacterium]MBF0251391.1 amidophosphoribosyltransferase [Alphaproteobacteria bacterium]